MSRLIRRLHDSSELENIVLIFFSLIVLRIFNFTMSLEDLTFRLPRDVAPVSYVLQLQPDFTTELFRGEVTIAIDIFNEKRFIALHAKNLTISSARLLRMDGGNRTSVTMDDVMIKNIFVVDKFEMIVIEPVRSLKIGKYRLDFIFNGIMSKKSQGFFMMSYADPYTGESRKIATTRFEPTHARRVFPCFDEPRFRAIFDIILVQPDIDGYQSLSNMPVQSSLRGTPLLGLTTVYFKRSLPMSTYLVAFLMTDLVNRTAIIAKRWENYDLVPLRAWTTYEKTICLDLVLHMTYRALDLYMHVFRNNYPLPKLDVVAIPGLQSSFIENWGLILYDETSMLYFGRSNSINELKITTNRITYGLIQMWFGSLVTMSWWNDAWLSKSIATYLQYYTTNWAFPDWKENESFLAEVKFPSMTKDALISSLSFVQPTDSTKEIDEFLHSFSQKKGASIIRMLHHMMGEQQFFYGVSYYLQVYRFNTAVMNDFIICLQIFHLGGENLTRFVDTWTRQSGFPVLNIERINDTYYIDQTRYLCNNISTYNPSDSPYFYKWDLPLFYTTSMSNGTKRIFMPHNSRRIKLLVDKQVIWVKFNTNSVGYYTINYDLRTWKIFAQVLQAHPKNFRELDRADLINDAFLNADAGRIPYDIPMSMLECMRYDDNYTPWLLVSEKLLSIHMILRGTEISEEFKAFVSHLVSTMYLLVGWDSHPADSFERRRLRVVILKIACAVGLKKCIEQLNLRFRFWMKNTFIRPHPDVKELIYYYGMLNAGDENDWKIVHDLFVEEPDFQERRKLMICLTAIQNSTILMKYLENSKNNTIMSNEEYLMIFRAATLNIQDPTIVWNFYRKNWDYLTSRYPDDNREFARLIVSVMSKLRGRYLYYETIKFFKDHPHNKLNEDGRKEALEIVRNNIAWMETNYGQIKIWLRNFYGKQNHL